MRNDLTARQRETVRRQAVREFRKALDLQRPRREDFGDESQAAQWILAVLNWSKFSVVGIALAAGIASAIRNISAVYQNYTAAGTPGIIAALAAGAFVVAVEVTIFVIALAQAGREMTMRAENRPRQVTSLWSLVRSILVRLGLAQPKSYDEMAERDSLGLVLWMAMVFAIIANLAVALSPVLAESGQSLQEYMGHLPAMPGSVQMTFILDVALALLPPMLALMGGHLTAKFATEYARESMQFVAEWQAAMAAWRELYNDPSGDPAFEALLEDMVAEREAKEAERSRTSARTSANAPSVRERSLDIRELSDFEQELLRMVADHYTTDGGPSAAELAGLMAEAGHEMGKTKANGLRRQAAQYGLLEQDEAGRYRLREIAGNGHKEPAVA